MSSTTTNRNEGFLADIIAHPDDDAPRLVYADWLDDHGDAARAEFIRLQCQPARVPLQERISELLRLHGHDWAAGFTGPRGTNVSFRRGFVEELATTAERLIRRGADWAVRTPLRKVRLAHVAGHARRLFASSFLANLTELEICDSEFGDGDAIALAMSRQFPLLRSLVIQGDPASMALSGYWVVQIGSRGFRALTAAEFFPRLRELRVTSKRSLDSPCSTSLEPLGEPGAVMRLRVCELSGASIDDHGAINLANADGFEHMISLNLWSNAVGDDGLIALLTSPRQPKLIEFRLDLNQVTSTGLEALADVACPPSLKFLDLSHTQIRDVNGRVVEAILERNPGLSLGLEGLTLPAPVKADLWHRFHRRVGLDCQLSRRRTSTRIYG